MKPYTRTIFILILIVPLALLAWLGQRSLTQDRIVSEHQSAELAESRLREAQTLIHSFISDLQQSAVTALSLLQIKDSVNDDHIALIREVVNSDPYLEHVFILDPERTLLFPRDTRVHSNTERSFSEELLIIIKDENAFRVNPVSENDDSPLSEYGIPKRNANLYSSLSRSRKIDQTIADTSRAQQGRDVSIETGWTTWDAGTSTDIFLWQRTANKVLIGQKLSYSYWLSQLIARLPSSITSNVISRNVSLASIRLVDKRQRSIYQWGNYPIEADNSQQPISKEWLTYPLDGWRLEYYAPLQDKSHTQTLMFIVSFLSLLALMGVGGRLIWQEYRREMRNAEQRVSFVNQVSHELKTPLTNICIMRRC
ncbi:MAG: hypothetical protein JKX81_13750 [Arenicella sp.]|nr:hypothetical protein [Arenicella sp.]